MSTNLRSYKWSLTALGAARTAKKAVAARIDTKAGAVRITKDWRDAVELCAFVPGEAGGSGGGGGRLLGVGEGP